MDGHTIGDSSLVMQGHHSGNMLNKRSILIPIKSFPMGMQRLVSVSADTGIPPCPAGGYFKRRAARTPM